MSDVREEGEGPREADPQVQAWERFLKTYYKPQVNESILNEDNSRWPTLTLQYFDLDKFDQDLAAETLVRPIQQLRKAQVALATVDVPELLGPRPKVSIHIEGLPEESRMDASALRPDHIGKLVSVRGIVRSASFVEPRVADAVYECLRCGALLREPQEDAELLSEPVECYEDQGGCARQSNFKLILSETRGQVSRMTAIQRIHLQEPHEAVQPAMQPAELTVWAEDSLTARLRPGDVVRLNGVYRTRLLRTQHGKKRILGTFLELVSIEYEQEEFGALNATPEDVLRFQASARNPDGTDRPEHLEDLTASYHPSIVGYSPEKLSLLLALAGGTPDKFEEDGSRIRWDIHIFLVGDPGTAKTQLMLRAVLLSPRGIRASGTSTTGVGLTAAAVQDKDWPGNYRVEGGALSLATHGHAGIDEADKMKPDDRKAMHEAMETQEVDVHKGNAHMRVLTLCGVFMVANPKQDRFDTSEPLSTQIGIPPTLLSRFDLIWVFVDELNRERDTLISRTKLERNRAAALRAQRLRGHAEEISTAPGAGDAAAKAPFDTRTLRKFIAHIRRSFTPVLSADAIAYLQSEYVQIRDTARQLEDGTIPLTARQLDALIRLAEARAKLYMRNDVTLEDAQHAVKLVRTMLAKLSGRKDSILDADVLETGRSSRQRNHENLLVRVVRDYSAGASLGALVADVRRELSVSHKLSDTEIEAVVKSAKKQNLVQGNDEYLVLGPAGRERLR